MGLFLAGVLLSPVLLNAQAKTVTVNGRITSFEESLPLEGVSILVKNSSNGTGTQADGSFTLTVLPDEKILLVSLPGYEKKEVPLTKSREYNIVLKRVDNLVSRNCLYSTIYNDHNR